MTIARLAEWANPYEVTLARDFVEHLDGLQEKDGETGSILLPDRGDRCGRRGDGGRADRVPQGQDGARPAGEDRRPDAAGRPVGGLQGAVAGRRGAGAGRQQRRAARNWVASGKFPLKTKDAKGKVDAAQLADGVAEGIISRLVRAQMTQGPSPARRAS